MSIPIEAVIDRPGRTPLRLTPLLESLRFSTAAVGGYSNTSFALPGDPARWKRELPHLATVRLIYDTQIIWEGQLEDITLKLLDGASAATVNCFGLQRLLTQQTVRRIWSMRSIDWHDYPTAPGGAIGTSGLTITSGLSDSQGQIDVTDLTKTGLRVAGVGTALAGSVTLGKLYTPPSGLTLVRVMGTLTLTGANTGAAKLAGIMLDSSDGTSWSGPGFLTTSQSVNRAMGASSNRLLLGAGTAGAITPTASDTIDWTDLRVLGTSVTEDASGGFYGGTILRDLIALVPGLSIGIIEDGSDYTIPQIERSVRSAALDVVSEVSSYYTREWRVWEEGRFDWKAVNKDEPQWVTTLADLADGSELTTTVDGLAQGLVILYVDAASGLDAETISTSTDQRNPFVKQGKPSGVLASPGIPMTSGSAQQLGDKLLGDIGTYPPVRGRLLLPATKVIRRASGSPLPALMIRGGDNITVADLPKTDLFAQGRDGESLFHVVSTETDLGSAMTTLEVEGQLNRADVILARLAASTRTLTG